MAARLSAAFNPAILIFMESGESGSMGQMVGLITMGMRWGQYAS